MLRRLNFFNFIIPVYLTGALLAFPYFKYYIATDGVCYISIAQKYIQGDYQNAVNGFWSPLLSWLLIPFIKAGIDPLQAGRVIGVGFGLGVLYCFNKILNRVSKNNLLVVGGLLGLLPAVIFVGIAGNYPDFLLLFYTCLVYLFTTTDDLPSKSNSILLGLVAGLGYLSKAYFFWFFLLWISFVLFIWVFVQKNSLIAFLKRYSFSLILFFLISLPWIGIISAKYDKVMISSAGSHNYSLKQMQTDKHPLEKLSQPPNETAINISEDKTILNLPLALPFSSPGEGLFLIKLLLKHILLLFWILANKNLLAWAILAGAIYCLYLQQGSVRQLVKNELFWMVSFSLTYVSGYLLLIVFPRYVMVFIFMLIPMGIFLLEQAYIHFKLKGWQLAFFVVVIMAGAAFPYFNDISKNINSGKSIYLDAQKLSSLSIRPYSNIASDNDWFRCFYLCYHLNLQYYGMIQGHFKNEKEIENALLENDIEYFLMTEPIKTYSFLSKYQIIYNEDIVGLKMYKIK